MIRMPPGQFAPLLLLWLSMSVCEADVVPQKDPPVQYPAANLEEDTYQPGPNWQLVWSDEFEGETLDPAKWKRQVVEAGRFNREWQRYTDSRSNAYIDNGCLVIKAIHESDTHGPDQYTSARLHTLPENGWTYGKIAARIQLPYGHGIWPAFWMLGANIDENGGDTPWPQSGEIDILEMYGSRDNAVVEANIHYAGTSGRHASMGAVGTRLEQGKFADNFHVFEIEWDADRFQWFVDGRQFASTPIAGDEFSEFHKPFFILLNIAVGGRSAGPADDTTRFPQTMYVDWVRVYQ
ncbi:MAG: family 16 glycosylhydrolase [Gammaproteobacteria bacterium]|jgi:beta-glucanase (GH16 family)|nr:family 16 glycosylhydrolase [Gammaproteobacteria bacterium]